ncbi:hypothetical protein [Stratiformator vulcanicus]|uniref:DUF4886 domain-containing protein n=1 Tax=Stratiformator vulcanicus TaxID=2527980 RepID=A0A517R4A6_9PLAN|nr:hypothetical protein [Stratiformator vulcanicus]QDT38719.1 hypothetical protein Pan189_31160 [Stratiformator vulcanicus]
MNYCFSGLKHRQLSRRVTLIALAVPALLFSGTDLLRAEENSKQPRTYLIGNSLTWDTVPSRLDGDVTWHVGCGKSLQQLHDSPEKPCVKTSVLWPKTLRSEIFNYLCVQPHGSTTLEQDVRVISAWIRLQPECVLVLHQGWATKQARDAEYESTVDDRMHHGPVYFAALSKRLNETFTDLRIVSTDSTEILQFIGKDLQAGDRPVENLNDLYRDDIHMTYGPGRFLMHNMMRRALSQPYSDRGFERVPEAIRTYLLGRISAFHEERDAHPTENISARYGSILDD